MPLQLEVENHEQDKMKSGSLEPAISLNHLTSTDHLTQLAEEAPTSHHPQSNHFVHLQPAPQTALSTVPATQLTAKMFLQRAAVTAARRAATTTVVRRTFATSMIRRE